jgi:hypothetical protein
MGRKALFIQVFQPFLRFWFANDGKKGTLHTGVSTLLEILGLVYLVVVGF